MKVKMEITYQTPKKTETILNSEEMNAKAALIIAEDFEKTKRAKQIIFYDHQGHSWTMKELTTYMAEVQEEPHDIKVYFDGGFDLETKKSGLGCAIYYEQNGKSYRLRKNALVEELDTNNEAEYAALHLAIQELEELGVHHLPVTFVGDSQVVINQLKDEWPVFENVLSNWMDRIEGKLKDLGIQPEYEVVSRKKNKEADQLASQALQNVEILSTSEVDRT